MVRLADCYTLPLQHRTQATNCSASALRRFWKPAASTATQAPSPKAACRSISAVDLAKGGESGAVVVAGKPDESLLLEYISGDEPQMPQGRRAAFGAEVAAIREWIEDGAEWPDGLELVDKRQHDLDWWSLRPLTRPAVPAIESRLGSHADRRLYPGEAAASKSLSPSPEADRRTLIRRLYFDLIGLPPTPEEVEAFVADDDPHAYEKLVDRLLASPHYGERWGRHWLDVVHYGDTHGYDKDKLRPNAWPYRDYVIRAFNDDKPYSAVRRGTSRRRRALSRHGRRHHRHRVSRRRAVRLRRARSKSPRARSPKRSRAISIATTW